MILLYNPKSNPTGKPILPMAVMAMGGMLEGRHPYKILDGNLASGSQDNVLRMLKETGAPIIAITVMAAGPQLNETVPLCRKIKEQFPEVVIIWGGYFPTLYSRPVKESGLVDFFFRGHPDHGFLSLVEALATPEPDFGAIPNLTWRDGQSGQWVDNAMGPVPPFDALPDFPYHMVPMEKYVRKTFLGSRTVAHHSSYGCPFLCNFCGVVDMVSGRYAAQSAEQLEKVVVRLIDEFGANAVEFYDNNFMVQERRIAEFCERIIPLDIQWWCFARVDTMMKYSEDTWRKLRDSGLKMVFLGAETGSDETLAQMNKGGKQSANQTLALAQRMKQYGIVPELSFVFGIPPNPEKDIHNTFRFIRKVKEVNAAAEIIFYIYTPVPVNGTVTDAVKESGFKFPSTIDEWVECEWMDSIHHRTSALPWLESKLVREIQDYRLVLQTAYPTITDPNLRAAKRALLKIVGLWRYKLGFYRFPYEIKALNRILPHQRPETSGF